jgi:hypothetical protein
VSATCDGAANPPPAARARISAGQTFDGGFRGRIELGLFVQLRERGLQRGNLVSELTGRIAVAVVLDPQRFVR